MTNPLALDTRHLLLGAGLLFTAGGLHGLVLPIRAEIEAFPTALVGLIGSAYAVGHVTGCLVVPGFVRAVGHIRVFSVMATFVAIGALLNILAIHPLPWIAFRAVSGFAFAGAAMIIESWLNESASASNRGQVFARYMLIILAGSVIGQMATAVLPAAGYQPFVLVAMLACLALLPTALNAGRSPAPLTEFRLDLRGLFRTSPIAAVGCFMIGQANGAFGTLAAIYARGLGLTVAEVALVISGAVLGGALMQMPLGRLSDRTDRRYVFGGTALVGALIALVLLLVEVEQALWVIVAVTLLGGALHTLYPVAVAHANDMASDGNFVAVSSGLLLLFGAGAAIGPAIAAALMQWGGPKWLFLFLALIYLPLAGYTAWRISRRAVPGGERDAFVGLQTPRVVTPETVRLDPRA